MILDKVEAPILLFDEETGDAISDLTGVYVSF